MDFTFERGSIDAPRGHALMYFRSSKDFDDCWATYMIVLPILVDVAKYVPPFLMNQMGEIGPKDLSSFAFPPAPEPVGDYSYVEELASAREDDIVFGGTVNPDDVTSTMMRVNEAIGWYAQAYSDSRQIPGEPETAEASEALPGYGVSEVLYDLMSDSDKLGELTKLVGRLRDAVESGDDGLTAETQSEIDILGRLLPDNHQIDQLAHAAKIAGETGAKLANLYLQRCFHLLGEEYVKLGQVEEDIQALEAGEAS